MKKHPTELDALLPLRARILRLVFYIENLRNKIDEAFAGQLFLPSLPPDAPANRQRINTYVDEQMRVTKLLAWAAELYLLTCGLKREEPWVPIVVEQMRIDKEKRKRQRCKRSKNRDDKSAKVDDGPDPDK